MMTKIKTFISTNMVLIYVFVTLLVTFIYHYNLVITDPILNFDDRYMINQVYGIKSLSAYIGGLLTSSFLDIQPIRDLSYLMDLWLLRNFQLSTFHFVNTITLLMSFLFIYKILNRLPLTKREKVFIYMLVLCHPVMHSSAAWISARKHLLAFLFILMAINEYLKDDIKIRKKAFFYYVISVLSQPIYALFPIVILIYKKSRRDSKLNYLIPLTVIMVIVVNLYYYDKLGTLQISSFLSIKFFSTAVLSIGRSFIQQVFPIHQAGLYDEASYLNMIGIILVPLFWYGLIKVSNNKKTVLLFFVAYFLSFILTCPFFVKESYLLLSTIIFFTGTIYLTKSIRDKYINASNLFITAWLVLFSYNSFLVKDMWVSDLDLWKTSYESEGGLLNTSAYAYTLVQQNPNKALSLAEDILINYEDSTIPVSYVIGRAIFYGKNLTESEQVNLYSRYVTKYEKKLRSPWTNFFLAKISFSKEEYQEGFLLIGDYSKNYFVYALDPDIFWAEVRNACGHFRQSTICKDLK